MPFPSRRPSSPTWSTATTSTRPIRRPSADGWSSSISTSPTRCRPSPVRLRRSSSTSLRRRPRRFPRRRRCRRCGLRRRRTWPWPGPNSTRTRPGCGCSSTTAPAQTGPGTIGATYTANFSSWPPAGSLTTLYLGGGGGWSVSTRRGSHHLLARPQRSAPHEPPGERQRMAGRPGLGLDPGPVGRRHRLCHGALHDSDDDRRSGDAGSVGEGRHAGRGLPGHDHRGSATSRTRGVRDVGLLAQHQSGRWAGSTALFTAPTYLPKDARHLSAEAVRAREDPDRSDRAHLQAGNRTARGDLGSRWRSSGLDLRHAGPRSAGHRRPRWRRRPRPCRSTSSMVSTPRRRCRRVARCAVNPVGPWSPRETRQAGDHVTQGDTVTDRYWFDNSLSDEGSAPSAPGEDRRSPSIALLNELGVAPGSTCAELGAGGGSMAAWLADRVGHRRLGPRRRPQPQPVPALGSEYPNVELLEAELETLDLESRHLRPGAHPERPDASRRRRPGHRRRSSAPSGPVVGSSSRKPTTTPWQGSPRVFARVVSPLVGEMDLGADDADHPLSTCRSSISRSPSMPRCSMAHPTKRPSGPTPSCRPGIGSHVRERERRTGNAVTAGRDRPGPGVAGRSHFLDPVRLGDLRQRAGAPRNGRPPLLGGERGVRRPARARSPTGPVTKTAAAMAAMTRKTAPTAKAMA